LFLVPATLLYAICRRAAKAGWDLYGPAIAIISVIIIEWELVTNMRY
jgi:hypothetical protein